MITSKQLDKAYDSCINCSANETVLMSTIQKHNLLKSQRNEQVLLKEHLLQINKKNENISKNLQNLKKEYETVERDMKRRLLAIKLTTDKENIIMRKKLEEYYTQKRNFEEQYKKVSIILELEDLISENTNLLKQYSKITSLLESTKKQYNEIKEHLINNFRNIVCEFCDTVLKIK